MKAPTEICLLGLLSRKLPIALVSRRRHNCGVARVRLSTTVDADLIDAARHLRPGTKDAPLVDEALRALLAMHRAAKSDVSYGVYDQQPIDQPDECGDLASWQSAAGTS